MDASRIEGLEIEMEIEIDGDGDRDRDDEQKRRAQNSVGWNYGGLIDWLVGCLLVVCCVVL